MMHERLQGTSSIRFLPFPAIRSVLAKSKKTTQAKTLRSHSSRKDRSSHSRIENSKYNRGALDGDQTAHHRSRDRIEARLSFHARLEAASVRISARTRAYGSLMMLVLEYYFHVYFSI